MNPDLAGVARRTGRRLWRGAMDNGGAILVLAGIVLLWLGVLHSLGNEHKQAMRGAAQNASNLARAFEENLIRSIKAVDQSLLYLRDYYEKDPTNFDASAWIKNTQAVANLTFQISLIDKQGMMIGSNLAPNGNRIDLSDREHFRVQRSPEKDELFISKPVFGRASNKWSIQMTRKLIAPDGTFNGVVVASLDPEYLSRFYASVDLGRRGMVTLLGTDGIVRARAGAGGASAVPGDDHGLMDRSWAGGQVLARVSQSPAGTFLAPSEIDGVSRVRSYRVVRGYPLVVIVSLAEDDVFEAYRATRRSDLLLASALTVLLCAIMALLIVRHGRLRRAQQALWASEVRYAAKSEMLEATLEHMSQGIMMIDADNRVQVCNHRALMKLGLPAELMDRHPLFEEVLQWQWSQNEFGAGGADLDESVQAFVKAGGINDSPHIYERQRPNGVVLEIRSIPLPGGGVVRTYTDVTRRKQAEIVLLNARDEATRATEAKSQFLAMMSHEIRSPMGGLIGVLELLRASPLDPEQIRMTDMIHGSAAALLGVLNDILDFSKIEAGACTIAIQATALCDEVTQLVQPYAVAAASKGVKLRVHLTGELPCYVQTDPLRVKQILNNLLSNAVKFTQAGTIDLTGDVLDTAAARYIRLSVRDSGIGMSAETLDKLFQPFVQADGSTTRDFGGTGLGLSISRSLATLLSGTLTVKSRLGAGSVFELLIPLVLADAPADQASLAKPLLEQQPALHMARVLVADDDPTNRWLFRRQLEQLGVSVDLADNGETALEALKGGQYDLLVTDCHMPRMDGVSLTWAIRTASDPALNSIPIIGLTADGTSALRDRWRAAGMTEIAVKPLTLKRLSELVSAHLPSSGTIDKTSSSVAVQTGTPRSVVFDRTIYNDIFDVGDPEGQQWLVQYYTMSERLIAHLQTLMTDLDRGAEVRNAIGLAAHQLAGSSLSAGAVRLGEQARKLEREVMNGELGVLSEHVSALQHEFSTLLETLHGLGLLPLDQSTVSPALV